MTFTGFQVGEYFFLLLLLLFLVLVLLLLLLLRLLLRLLLLLLLIITAIAATIITITVTPVLSLYYCYSLINIYIYDSCSIPIHIYQPYVFSSPDSASKTPGGAVAPGDPGESGGPQGLSLFQHLRQGGNVEWENPQVFPVESMD